MRRRVAILLALVVALAAAPSTLAAQPAAKPSYLFAMTSTGGSLKHDASGWWVTLNGTSPMVTRFTDRPGREAATMTPTQLANRWRAYGFAKDAPNAALVLDGRSADSDVYVVELRSPRVEGSTVVFRAKPLKTTSHALRHYMKRADHLQETAFGRASLFIDDGGQIFYQQVSFLVQNVTPGQSVTIDVAGPTGFPVSFATGPSWGRNPWVWLSAQPGLSIGQFTVNNSTLSVQTSPAGSGAPVTFSLVAFVAIAEGTNDFGLATSSDPGVAITATTGSPDGPFTVTLGAATQWLPTSF